MTIKDIARLSGCGVATVSRVLNGNPGVSERTRRKVMAVVKEQGFRPNNNAKHLKQQAGGGVAIVVKGTLNPMFADLVERLQTLLQEAGETTGVYYRDEDADEVAFAAQLVRERHPRGLLFLGGNLELFRGGFGEVRAPSVLLTNNARDLGFPNLSSFTTDDAMAARRVIGLLAEHGHRRIGILGGDWTTSQISQRRLTGCREACEELGIALDVDSQCEPCRYSMADAYAAARRLMERRGDLTAIFAFSDVMALGAIRALRDMDKRVPEDISVVGYDGIVIGRYSLPRLTTVQQDTQRLAQRGVETLLRRMEEDLPPVHELVPFRLIAGESVARVD